MLLDSLPVTGWSRVNWSRFEDSSGDTICEGSVNDIGVASDPTNVSHAGKFVVRVDIENVFYSEGGAKKVSTSGMNNALWFSCGSGSLDMENSELSKTI